MHQLSNLGGDLQPLVTLGNAIKANEKSIFPLLTLAASALKTHLLFLGSSMHG